MKNQIKTRGLALALALLMAAGTPLYAVQAPVQAAVTMAVKKGLKLEKGNYYYYVKGKKVKNTWKTIGKKKYYFKASGAAAVGWNKIGKKAYYFSAKGVMAKGKTVDKVKLGSNGQAALSDRAVMLVKAQSVLEQKTKSTQTKAQKLKACYQDMLKCSYLARFFPTDTADWEVQYAYDMLTNRKGNCYSYASAFAMLAKACGYNAKIVTGQLNKDANNIGPHAWVEIGGKVYDPQTQQNMDIDLYGKAYSEVSSRVTYTISVTIDA